MKRKAAPKKPARPQAASVPALPPKPPLVIPPASSLGTSVANLVDVQALALRQVAIEDEIKGLAAKMEEAARRLAQIRMVDLPIALQQANLRGIKLDNGMEVKVEDFITGNIKEENRAAAFKWLRGNKFGSLIKNTFAVPFGMGTDKQAKRLAAFLKKEKIEYERKESVHPSTLKAFVREQIEAGKVTLPPEIEVHSVPTATIIRPKE